MASAGVLFEPAFRLPDRPDTIPAPASAPALAEHRVWLVPHTHWDREWYLPFEQFRMRLVRTIENLLDVMESDPRIRHFTLDGQTVLLEDCAELRPDLIPRLRALADAGRLSVGPGYVMPDEFLPGPEALVRNLLHGQAVARQFGFEPMPLGYAPDPFGHPAQLPQILRGFGLEDFLFWRGLGDEADALGAVFWWRAPDGTRVLAHQLLGSYGNANQLGSWSDDGVPVADAAGRPRAAAYRPVRFVARHRETLARSTTRDLLLCNGSDHEPIQTDIADMAEVMAAAHPGLAVRIAGYAEYIAAARIALPPDLATHRGEMVDGRVAAVLRGINSSRMPLKQSFAATEEALLVAEAVAALAALRVARPYPHAELRHAWRELLRNAPHDSISGCSVDETHHAMAGRFASATEIANRVRREAIAALAGHEARWSYQEPVGAAYSVLNALPWARRDVVELAIPAELRGMAVVARAGHEAVAVQVSANDADRAWAAVDLAPYGAVTLHLEAADPGGPRQKQAAAAALRPNARRAEDSVAFARATDDGRIESDAWVLEVLPDGSIATTERSTGRRWTGLHVFEDVADRGDEYNFCPLEGDTPRTTVGRLRRVRVVEAGPLVAELEVELGLRLPRALRADRAARTRTETTCVISSRIRLVAGSDRIEFRTRLVNRAWDHRLRVLFAAPELGSHVVAEGAYALVERPTRPLSSGAGWLEPPAATHHTRGLVTGGGVTICGVGLPEYEALASPGTPALALTLLRCVGWLSREDLTSRPGGAGPSLPVPEAQCAGEHRFEYAVWLGEASPTEQLRRSAEWRRPLVSGEPGVPQGSLLPVDGYGFADGALKGAQDGDGIVFRVFAGPDGGCVALPDDLATEACRLDEEPLERDPGPMLPPARIASWRIRA